MCFLRSANEDVYSAEKTLTSIMLGDATMNTECPKRSDVRLTMRDPKSLTVIELKEILRRQNLSTAGNKNELLNRLVEVDPCNAWVERASGEGDGGAMDAVSRPVNRVSGEAYGCDEDGGGARRALEARNGGGNVDDVPYMGKSSAMRGHGDHEGEHLRQREIEMCRREKELVERELALARREIEFLRLQNNPVSDERRGILAEATNREEHASRSRPACAEAISFTLPAKINVTAIADLLNYFNGDSEIYETWEKQVRFIRAT